MNISQFLKSLGLEHLRDIFEREQVRTKPTSPNTEYFNSVTTAFVPIWEIYQCQFKLDTDTNIYIFTKPHIYPDVLDMML